jgi:hypothetical protein
MDDFQQMREYMGMAENLIGTEPEMIIEAVSYAPVAMPPAILEDLHDVIFKLRAFTESREGDIGLGIELGMQRAADMIENVIKRHAVLAVEFDARG